MQIFDYMGSTELAANLFLRDANRGKFSLRPDDVIRQAKRLNETHHDDIGAKVRQTIKDLGGTMPEALPTPKRTSKSLDNQRI